jgi:ribonuclease-3
MNEKEKNFISAVVYLGNTTDTAIKFCEKLLLSLDKHFEKYNAKDILQQYTQGYNKTRPEYNVVSVTGPAHKPIFNVEVMWNEQIIAKACGKSKKEAEQAGALEACKKLGIINK